MRESPTKRKRTATTCSGSFEKQRKELRRRIRLMYREDFSSSSLIYIIPDFPAYANFCRDFASSGNCGQTRLHALASSSFSSGLYGQYLQSSLLISHLQHYTSDYHPLQALPAKMPPLLHRFSYRERGPSTRQYPHTRLVRPVRFRFPLFSVQGTQPFTSQHPSFGLSGQKTLLYIFLPHKKRPARKRCSLFQSNGKSFIASFAIFFSHFFQNIRLHNHHLFFFHNLKQRFHRLSRSQTGF